MPSPFFHCQSCLTRDTTHQRFSITSCKHVFCDNCIAKGAVTVDKVCTACKGRNTKVLALTPDNMKQNRKLAILFRAPEDIIREAYEDMRMAIEFQNKNLNNLVAGMGMICQKAKDESNQRRVSEAQAKSQLEKIKATTPPSREAPHSSTAPLVTPPTVDKIYLPAHPPRKPAQAPSPMVQATSQSWGSGNRYRTPVSLPLPRPSSTESGSRISLRPDYSANRDLTPGRYLSPSPRTAQVTPYRQNYPKSR